MTIRAVIAAFGCVAFGAAAVAAQLISSETRPTWAYPAARTQTLPGSAEKYGEVQLYDRTLAIDWFPGQHPPMPDAVKGRPSGFACGYCHLPTGNGRPENATLAGMPEAYIKRQIADFRSGARTNPSHLGSGQMTKVAKMASDADIDAAAEYFAAITFQKRVKVVETSDVPKATPDSVYVFDPDGPREPIGRRIIEGPDDYHSFELRDPAATFTAYVPPGSVAEGASLAQGARGTPPCEICHGQGLKGGPIGPPLAGHFATPTFRQLYGFKSGVRNGQMADLMKPIVAKLSQDDMIALSAYVASLEP